MVYHHRKVNCPNCGKIADRTTTTDSELLKGSPFRVCPSCGQTYFDSEYKEMGLVLFEEKGGKIGVSSILWTIISNAMVVVFLYFGFCEHNIRNYILPLVVFGILALLFDYGIIRTIKNHASPEKFHQSQIDYIEGRSKERSASVVESMNRLSNKNYLDALLQHGINIPDYFYERIGATKDSSLYTNYVNREDADYQELMKAQGRRRASKNLLALGVNSKEFKQAAFDSNMTPEELAEYCKKCVDDYDDLHREYNLTHKKTVKYPES